MHDIKKKLILVSVFLLASPVNAEVYGCIDTEGFTLIHNATIERLKNALVVRLQVDEPNGIELTQKTKRDTLEVLLYGSYINHDHVQLSHRVSLLEYTGYTMLKVVGGKRVISHKVEGENTLVLVIKT